MRCRRFADDAICSAGPELKFAVARARDGLLWPVVTVIRAKSLLREAGGISIRRGDMNGLAARAKQRKD